MVDGTRILEPTAAEPIVLDPRQSRRLRSPDPLPTLARLACALVGLTLPALGIAFADTVHPVGEPRATQVAAPADPPGGAAAPRTCLAYGASRVMRPDRSLAGDARREIRR